MHEIVTIQKAVDVSAAFGNAEFTMAVEQARDLGLQTVQIVTDEEDGTIAVARPDGLMIAWKPKMWQREVVAIPNGQPVDDIHLTILDFGPVAEFDADTQRTIIGVVSEVAAQHSTMVGKLNTFGRFLTTVEGDGDNALWVSGDFPGLTDLRNDLIAALDDAGVTWEDKFDTYVPHITVARIDQNAETPQVTVSPTTMCIDNITVYMGGLEYPVDLEPTNSYDDPYYDDGNWTPDVDQSAPNLYYPAILSKAGGAVLDDEKKYSYGAWYVPDSLDAHGEFAGADEVQEALWKYVDSGNRDIHIQHMDDVVAGRWVELATIPFPVSVPVEAQPGILRKHTYPAGTPFMGVKWDDWAWPLVKDGTLSGFSVGGTAERMDAVFDDATLAKARTLAPKAPKA